MSDAILIYESTYEPGRYPRVDFVADSLQRMGLPSRVYACGQPTESGGGAVGWEIRQSIPLRLLNFAAYALSLQSFPHFGYLVRMSRSLSTEKPKLIIFYRYWTGLFLLFWRQFMNVPAKLVWEWYDLDTRLHYFGKPRRVRGRLLCYLEEKFAPAHFDGLIVPTEFARKLLETWGHPPSKTHVMGEVRGLNPYVNEATIRRRIEDVKNGAVIRIAWVGILRHYQLEGLTAFIRALQTNRLDGRKISLDIVGPAEVDATAITEMVGLASGNIEVFWHGPKPREAVDRLLADAHAAVHPLPKALFTRYIYSRKMADYLAAALPVAYSEVEGLSEVGREVGIPFQLENPMTVARALGQLLSPDRYEQLSLQAWRVAHDEFSAGGLEKKGTTLVRFLTTRSSLPG